MQYLCVKQLTAGGVTYHPGRVIPDGVILPKRSKKLLRYGYISELGEMTGSVSTVGARKLYTQEEVEKLIAEAVETTTAGIQQVVSELEETDPDMYGGVIRIQVKGPSDGQMTEIPATTDEIQQVFSIMQMGAEAIAREISNVNSENVLILLHAADSRKMVKNAAKERADKLFPINGETNESAACNAITDTCQGG